MMFSPSPRFAMGLTAAVSVVALHTSPALAFDPSGNEIADAFGVYRNTVTKLLKTASIFLKENLAY